MEQMVQAKGVFESTGASTTTSYAILLRSMASWYACHEEGERAIEYYDLARRACEAAGTLHSPLYASILTLLAASLAEDGRFEEALALQAKACGVHQANGSLQSIHYARLCFDIALAKQALAERDGMAGCMQYVEDFQAAKEAFEAAGATDTADFADLQVHLKAWSSPSKQRSPSSPREISAMEATSPNLYVDGASNDRSLATYDKVPFPGVISQKPVSAKDAIQSCAVAAWSPMEVKTSMLMAG